MAGQQQYRKRNPSRQRGSMLGQLLLVLVVFVAGYLSASLYDLAHVTTWIGSQLLSNNNTSIVTKSNVEQAQLPKPKFEFYTLLANEQAVSAQTAQPQPSTAAIQPVKQSIPQQEILAQNNKPTITAPTTPTVAVVPADKIPTYIAAGRDAYMVQVASFKNMQEATRMKASLLMKGFDVSITSSTQQHMTWYRVIIGPFASRAQAQQAQIAFAKREHIMGMIRKMDA